MYLFASFSYVWTCLASTCIAAGTNTNSGTLNAFIKRTRNRQSYLTMVFIITIYNDLFIMYDTIVTDTYTYMCK